MKYTDCLVLRKKAAETGGVRTADLVANALAGAGALGGGALLRKSDSRIGRYVGAGLLGASLFGGTGYNASRLFGAKPRTSLLIALLSALIGGSGASAYAYTKQQVKDREDDAKLKRALGIGGSSNQQVFGADAWWGPTGQSQERTTDQGSSTLESTEKKDSILEPSYKRDSILEPSYKRDSILEPSYKRDSILEPSATRRSLLDF